MASEWDDVLGQELQETRCFEQEVDGADENRTPSTAPADELSQSGHGQTRPAVWWAVLLKAAGASLGLEGVSTSQAPKIRIISGCTGCSAEAFVLKAGPAAASMFGSALSESWDLKAGSSDKSSPTRYFVLSP